jgi:hypothetical protein
MAVKSGDFGGSSKGGSGGGGYMQGIAAIGSTLNQTHSNVQNTLEWVQDDPLTRRMKKASIAQGEADVRQGDRTQNLTALNYLSGQREMARQSANRMPFRKAMTKAIGA